LVGGLTGALANAVASAAEFKTSFREVIRTDIATPLDSFASTQTINRIDWLNQIIDHWNEKKDDRLLCVKFLENHPGLEHQGGVPRGGTFVLGYDESGTVIA